MSPLCAVYQQLMLRGTKDHQFLFLLNLCPSQQATKLDPMGKSHSFPSVTLNTRRRNYQYGILRHINKYEQNNMLKHFFPLYVMFFIKNLQ